jgi:hypothetical protein
MLTPNIVSKVRASKGLGRGGGFDGLKPVPQRKSATCFSIYTSEAPIATIPAIKGKDMFSHATMLVIALLEEWPVGTKRELTYICQQALTSAPWWTAAISLLER